MSRNVLILVFFLSLVIPVICPGKGQATPVELEKLHHELVINWKATSDPDQRQELLETYIKDLTSLVYYMRGNSRDRQTINEVRQELRKANNAAIGEGEIVSSEEMAMAAPAETEVEKAAPASQVAEANPAPVAPAAVAQAEPAPVPTPAPVQKAKPHTPLIIAMTQRGLAGSVDYSKGNIYPFTLGETGPKSNLTYWATGHRSTDSYGEIWLSTPDGERHRIGKWKKSYFDTPAAEIKKYSQLKPVSIDISDYLTTPGDYNVEFHWTDGIDPLVIFRVEIRS